MLEYPSISKQKPQFPAYLDFQVLRKIGIDRLQELSGKLWTDYNLHDPGVTILEVLCYAVTDLGYRNNLNIEDLLALKPGQPENNFFTPDQILTCNPVTILDIRKRLIDIPGVHNAWLDKVTTYDPPIYIDFANSRLQFPPPAGQSQETALRLNPRGLYTVFLDLDPDYHKNTCGQLYRSCSDVLDTVKQVLCSYRNLCEDIHDIVILDEEEIRLCADIELETDADGEDVLGEIYQQVQEFLVPELRFYTLQQLLDNKKSPAEIFAGRPSTLHTKTDEPYASHGFIDSSELEQLTLKKSLHVSDLYQEILNVKGVVAVKKLLIASYINGLPQTQETPWYLQLTAQYRPVLGVENSKVNLFKSGLPIPINSDEVRRRYYEQRAAHIKALREPYELDLAIPLGKYSDYADHYSIHHDFPLTYGISEDGLPEPVSAERRAQVNQLKGYLVFFDQLLANYLAQLAHVRDLFSWEVDEGQDEQNGHIKRSRELQRTYFTQPLNFPGWTQILDYGVTFWWKWYREITSDPNTSAENLDRKLEIWFNSLAYHLLFIRYLDSINEPPETYRDRRNRFLDHLLARFSESFTDYVLLNYRMFDNHQDKIEHEIHLIQEKARFLQDYPDLSRDRFRAFNYCNCNETWNTENVSGFKKRVSRLLGIEDTRRRALNHYQVALDPGGLIVSLCCGFSAQELIIKKLYSSEEEAQLGLKKILYFALCVNFYKYLKYKYYYHYGWEIEVIDEGEPIQVHYDAYFLSPGARQKALQPLLQALSKALQPLLQALSNDLGYLSESDIAACIHIESSEEELYFFRLEIPPTADKIGRMHFTGVQRYFSQEVARAKANIILKELTNPQNYHEILFHRKGEAERETQNPSHNAEFTHYGYALTDNEGTILAESSERFSSQENRDAALQRWLSTLRAETYNEFQQDTASQRGHAASLMIAASHQDQFEFSVEQTEGKFFFVLQHATDVRTVLRSLKLCGTEAEAWSSALAFAKHLSYLKRYISPAQDKAGQTYPLGITDENGTLLAISQTERNPLETFKRLNSVEPFLSIQSLQVESQPGQTTRYRFQLLDRNRTILLEGTQLFEDADTARDRFYQDVLGVLFEPGMRYSSTTTEGFGFGVISRQDRNSKVAVHPQIYASEQERDAVVNQLFLLLRTARLTITTKQQKQAYIGCIYGPDDGSILLQGTQRHNTPEAAWEHGNYLIELASAEVEFPTQGNPDSKNFRLIDIESVDGEPAREGDSPAPTTAHQELYGWELANQQDNQILASHFYTSKDQRNQAIKALQQQVNDEGFHVLEHILLRPQQPLTNEQPVNSLEHFLPIYVNPEDAKTFNKEASALNCRDPYSFWVSIILPYWPARFQDIKFRRFVERTLRLEAPAHIALKIAWVNVQQMHEFETAYRAWLEQLAQIACVGEACDFVGALNHLLDILPQLRSIYPQGNLYDPQVSSDRTNPIILNQTALGSAQD